MSRIFVTNVQGDRRMVECPIAFPEAVYEHIGEHGDYDGVDARFDPSAHGLTTPFSEGDAVVLVTTVGLVDARISGLGAWLGGDTGWLLGLLDQAPTGDSMMALAVFGGQDIEARARLNVPAAVPLGARVGLAIDEARAALPKLVDEFSTGVELEEAEKAKFLQKLRVNTGCATTYGPALAPGFEQLLIVNCNGEDPAIEPALSGVVLLGERPQVLYPWSLDNWSVQLHAVVDLDGDGIDELWMETSGHEWYETSLWYWDGERYVAHEMSADSV